MQRNECKPGTKVIIRGTVLRNNEPGCRPICVELPKDGEVLLFAPDEVEPAQPKYDPARKYRKGDVVRITGFHGRLFGCGSERKLSEGNKIGTQVTLCGNEDFTGDVTLTDGVLSERYSYISVACIELVKPIEEIEAEHPYSVKDVGSCFQVRKEGNFIYEIFWESNTCPKSPYSKEEALKKAQELCDELNRKHRESLNA